MEVMSQTPPDLPYCIECGARLEPGARMCPLCGTERWVPGAPPRRQPGPNRQPVPNGAEPRALTSAEVQATVASIPWIYAVGAFLNAGALAWVLAEGVTSGGRANWNSAMAQAGVPAAQFATTRVEGTVIFGVIFLLLAAGHAVAYQGLRAKKRWGWLVGVVLAALWSIILVGIPVLVKLVQRQVRAAYGVS
jgi:ribosomal protein L40E